MLRKEISYTIFSIFLLYSFETNSEEYFGKYHGKVQTEWMEEGRQMKLLSDFSFEDPNGLVWTAEKGSLVDGATIPKFLWSIVGSPFAGKYRSASIIHDIACDTKVRTWELVHLAFYYAMRASGVGSLKAKIMYAAVYHFGPRWSMMEYLMVKTAKTRIESVPARYETREDKVLVKPAYTTWVVGNGDVEVPHKIDEETGVLVHMVEVPATYKTVQVRKMVEPPSERSINIPEEYGMAEVHPLDKTLDENDFKKLISLIEKNESGETPIELSEIRNFHR